MTGPGTGGGEELARVLVVDDAEMTLEVIERNLAQAGHTVLTAGSVAQALEVLGGTEVELVITDLKMPGASGLDLVRHVRENLPRTEVVLITGYASINGAVEAIKHGAENYLAKPFTDDELLGAVESALACRRTRLAADAGGEEPDPPGALGLVGASPAMQRVRAAIRKMARSSATVLITGQSGTGKELVARAIHYASARASAQFVPVSCCSIPEPLLEAELFGHMKGAFTGATTTRAGFFQTADGGTIFLDEIGDMPLGMQARLLRVLQEREVCMVGSTKPRRVDVRVVAATNKDLDKRVKQGRFREDLFFRLNVLRVELPPVRERGDDVLLLVRHFAERCAEQDGVRVPSFTPEALRALRSYHWPGNVREIGNTVRRLVIMSEGGILDVADLPAGMRFSLPAGLGARRTLAEVEADHIRLVMSTTGGNKSQAARILGIDRKTLRDKLRRLEADRPAEGAEGGAAGGPGPP